MAFANYTVALSFDLVNQGIGYQIGLPPSAAGVRSLPAVPSAGRMVFVSVHEETGNALPVGGSYRLVFYACAPTQLALSRAERAGTLFFDETIAAVSTGTYAADFTQIAPGANRTFDIPDAVFTNDGVGYVYPFFQGGFAGTPEDGGQSPLTTNFVFMVILEAVATANLRFRVSFTLEGSNSDPPTPTVASVIGDPSMANV